MSEKLRDFNKKHGKIVLKSTGLLGLILGLATVVWAGINKTDVLAEKAINNEKNITRIECNYRQDLIGIRGDITGIHDKLDTVILMLTK